MSEPYSKIETLYERDEKTFKVKPGCFKNPVYSCVNPWRWTEKVDGTNIRIIYSPSISGATAEDALMNGAAATIDVRGRTDNANIPGRLLAYLRELDLITKMPKKFQGPVTLYGEGYGGGIQKGGYYVAKDEQKFILFDVLVDNKWWLSHENVVDVAGALGLDVVPDFGILTLAEASDYVAVGFKSLVASWAQKDAPAEGLVGRPLGALFDSKGHRLIVKLKTKDF